MVGAFLAPPTHGRENQRSWPCRWGSRIASQLKTWAVLFFALLVCVPASSWAADAAVQKAKLHFKRGAELYKAQHYEEAAREFQASYAAKPVGATLFNVAQCYDKLGDDANALKNYREYLRLTPRAEDRPAVEALIRTLEDKVRARPALQSLTVESTPSGARLLLDGNARGLTPFQGDVAVGGHDVQLTLEGYRPETRHLVVNADTPARTTLSLEPVGISPPPLAVAPATEPEGGWVTKREPRPLMKRTRVWTWVTLGVAVLAVGVGAGLGAAEKGTERKWAATAPENRDAADKAVATANGLAAGADVFYTVGGLALGGSAALFFLEGK